MLTTVVVSEVLVVLGCTWLEGVAERSGRGDCEEVGAVPLAEGGLRQLPCRDDCVASAWRFANNEERLCLKRVVCCDWVDVGAPCACLREVYRDVGRTIL